MRRLAIVVLAFALSGCASTTPAAPEPTPTPWINCDAVAGTEPVGTCPPPGNGPVHPENEAYRDRTPPSAQDQAKLDALIAPVTAALQPLADGTAPITAEAVAAAIRSVGIDDVQTTEGSGVAFGASTGFGCIFGGVRPGKIDSVEAGGYIRDGGCLALSGH